MFNIRSFNKSWLLANPRTTICLGFNLLPLFGHSHFPDHQQLLLKKVIETPKILALIILALIIFQYLRKVIETSETLALIVFQ